MFIILILVSMCVFIGAEMDNRRLRRDLFPERYKNHKKHNNLKMPKIIKIIIGIAVAKLIWSIDIVQIINILKR